MALSRPLISLLGTYLEQLYYNPIKTKAISCCVIATAGNAASQYIANPKVFNTQSLLAYSAFGLLFGGTIPHYFYGWLDRFIRSKSSFPILKKLFIERLIYTPLFQAFMLYMIARLEGKKHEVAVKQLESLYLTVLTSSWKYLTLLHLLNIAVVPPMLRVFMTNLIGFFWVIYIANMRRQQENKSKSK